MKTNKQPLTKQILERLLSATRAATRVFAPPHKGYNKTVWQADYQSFRKTVHHLKKQGLIKITVSKNGQRLLELTKNGELQILFQKALTPAPATWDGKWRMVVYDIPEDVKEKRHIIRTLLKKNGFVRLQGSVYINPHPLNREAVAYLKKTGLNYYIRIIKIEEMDNDVDLKRKFHL